MRALMVCLALAACGARPPATDAPPLDPLLMEGYVTAVGAGWRFHSDPESGLVVEFPGQDRGAFVAFAAPTATANGARFDTAAITARFEAERCTYDGVDYPMRASVLVGGDTLTGCAFVPWERRLVEFMPAIDACRAASSRQGWITYAAPMQDGVLVRMRGEGVDCRVRNGQAEVDVRDEALRAPGEGDALFVRAPGDQPGGQCYAAPEVRDGEGALLGWMADPLGC